MGNWQCWGYGSWARVIVRELQFFDAFFFQASIFILVNNHEWSLSSRLKVSNPKNALKISPDFWNEGLWQQLYSRKKITLMFAGSSTSVVWDLLCWDVRLSSSTILEQGLLGLSIPVFREHSFLISRYTGRFIRDRKWGRKSEVRLHERSWTARRVFSWTSPGSFVRGPFFCRQLYQALCWNAMSGV